MERKNLILKQTLIFLTVSSCIINANEAIAVIRTALADLPAFHIMFGSIISFIISSTHLSKKIEFFLFSSPNSLLTEILLDEEENISGINKRKRVLSCGSLVGSNEDLRIVKT